MIITSNHQTEQNMLLRAMALPPFFLMVNSCFIGQKHSKTPFWAMTVTVISCQNPSSSKALKSCRSFRFSRATCRDKMAIQMGKLLEIYNHPIYKKSKFEVYTLFSDKPVPVNWDSCWGALPETWQRLDASYSLGHAWMKVAKHAKSRVQFEFRFSSATIMLIARQHPLLNAGNAL